MIRTKTYKAIEASAETGKPYHVSRPVDRELLKQMGDIIETKEDVLNDEIIQETFSGCDENGSEPWTVVVHYKDTP
jgi:hypothetical protein